MCIREVISYNISLLIRQFIQQDKLYTNYLVNLKKKEI